MLKGPPSRNRTGLLGCFGKLKCGPASFQKFPYHIDRLGLPVNEGGSFPSYPEVLFWNTFVLAI